MSKKVIGGTVGTPMKPQAVIDKTEQAEQIAQNTLEIEKIKETGAGKDGYTPIKGVDYFDGKDGESVYVDSVTESYEDGGENVVLFSDGKSIKIRNGKRGQQGLPGEHGADGKPFKVEKTYESITAMNNGYSTDGVSVGGFVIITTGSVEDEDNAKLYVKGNTKYEFVTDMSGSHGIQGERGYDGYTPVKGTDYWTEADKADMVADVVAALPVYNGEVVSE